MLLESALADFSIDSGPRTVSKVQKPDSGSSRREPILGKPKRSSKPAAAAPSTSDAGPTKTKHAYHQQQRGSQQPQPNPSLKVPQRRQVMASTSTNSSLDLSRSPPPLDPALDVGSVSNRVSTHRSPVFGVDGRDPQKSEKYSTGGEAARCGRSESFVRSAFRVGPAAPNFGVSMSHHNNRRSPNFKAAAAGGSNLAVPSRRGDDNSASEIEIAEMPQSALSGKFKLKKDSATISAHQTSQQRHSPANRVTSAKEKNIPASPGGVPHRTLGSVLRPPMSRTASLNKEGMKQQQHNGKSVTSLTKNKPALPIGARSRDPPGIKHLEVESIKGTLSGQENYDAATLDKANSFRGANSEVRHRERSPVSILERIPSPQTTNSSGSSGSLVTKKITPAETFSAVAPAISSPAPAPAPATPVVQKSSVPGLALARRGLPSFSFSSVQESPRVSTSSSASYMNHCLVALQEALAVDPEGSKRFEESFVETDTYGARGVEHEGHGDRNPGHGGGESHGLDHYTMGHDRTRRFAKSPAELDEISHRDSLAWTIRSPARFSEELKPEYDAMDIYSSSDTINNAGKERDDSNDPHSSRSSIASAVHSPLESGSESSNALYISRTKSSKSFDQSFSGPFSLSRGIMDEFPTVNRDKQYFSERHQQRPISRIFHRGDDSFDGNGSIMSNSRCSSATVSRSIIGSRNRIMSFDDQSERAEELVRAPVDGLRFTYSPVSSAFVFTRSNEEEEDDEDDGDEDLDELEESFHHQYAPERYGQQRHSGVPSMHLFEEDKESDASRRFSQSLDYARSLCSDDDSFARGSEVSELGASRAESWSNVARGPPSHHHHQSPPTSAFHGLSHRPQSGNYQDAVPSSFLKRSGGGSQGAGPFESSIRSTRSLDLKSRALQVLQVSDGRLIRQRPSKKSAMVTCLPFRSILRNFKANASPARSRLGPANHENQMKWPSVANRLPY